MNENQTLHSIVVCFVVSLAVVCSSACRTVRADSSGLVLEHQRKIDELEGTIQRYDDAVTDAVGELESLTARSESMEGTVDELIVLFGEYQRRVDAVISALNRVRAEVEDEGQDNSSSGVGSSD